MKITGCVEIQFSGKVSHEIDAFKISFVVSLTYYEILMVNYHKEGKRS